MSKSLKSRKEHLSLKWHSLNANKFLTWVNLSGWLQRRKPKIQGKSPGGTGFQPVQSFQISRRNLPHWQEPGRVYFITWRCQKGQSLSLEERTITMKAIRYWDTIKWTVYAAVILPDHVHVLAQPLSKAEGGVFDLTEILHSVKSFSSQKINQQRGATRLYLAR